MSYYEDFTDSNRRILEGANLINKTLVKIEGESIRTTVEWSQKNMQLFGDVERQYRVAGFRTPDDTQVPVFVAAECGMPPSEFNTGGFQAENNGRLYFGIMDRSDSATLFFVIHPATWYPFQKRFAETDVVARLEESERHARYAERVGQLAGAAATAGATAAVGAAGVTLASGAAVTAAVGSVTTAATALTTAVNTAAGAAAVVNAATAAGTAAVAAAPIVLPFAVVAGAGAGAAYLAADFFDDQVGDYLRYIGTGPPARL